MFQEWGLVSIVLPLLVLALSLILVAVSWWCIIPCVAYLWLRVRKPTLSCRDRRRSDLHGEFALLGGLRSRSARPTVFPTHGAGAILDALLGHSALFPSLTIFRIRAWLQNCTTKHRAPSAHVCERDHDEGAGHPLWLIDIQDGCLVEYSPSLQYIALSYVWGEVAAAQTTVSNLTSLQEQRALLGPHAEVAVPRTIEHAMVLTGFLGQRYLWCDRLCIVQDDQGSKHAQIEQMAMIYARSYCTIIAMDGLDADTGIHGIPGLSQPVRATEHMSDVRLSKSVWQARGWTYQEEMFPARVIWLSHTGVSWQCSSQTNANFSGSEPKTRSLTRDVNLQTGDSLKFGGFTCPQSYAAAYYERLVKDYSRRAFGEHAPDDRYNAFLGIQRDIERRCAEPIMQGIPFGWLSHYLLWTSANVITSKNRLARRGGIAPPPSWSWTGWLTDVDFPQWKREGDEPDLGVVEWVSDGGVTSPAASTAAIALTDSWTKYPPCTPEAAMPSVHYNDTSSAQIHSSYQEDCTTTQALESSCHERFLLRGRVLVASFRVLQRDLIRPGLTLLVTKGDSGFAGVLHEVNADPWEGEVYVIAISEGAHAIATDGGRVPNGAMYSMHTPTSKRRSGYGYSDRFDHGPPFHWNDYDYDSEDSGLGKELHDYPEYVVQPMAFTYADDEGSLTTSMSSLVLDREYYPGSIYEYYNVMWVEWENGIAYRKGLARIARRVFERECLGWMDITLG